MNQIIRNEFQKAIKDGNINKVKSLILLGADLNENIGIFPEDTPIALAAFEEKIDIVALLTKEGAEVDPKCEGFDSALQYSIIKKRRDIAELLIKNGANLKFRGEADLSVLHIAINMYNPDFDSEVFDIIVFLVINGADVNAKRNLGDTPLHYAASGGCIKLLKYLIASGADATTLDQDGNTAYDIAVSKGFSDAAELLRC